MRLFRVLAYLFMLFLAFLHKNTTNCKVRDYKTAPFCVITYSYSLTLPSFFLFREDSHYLRMECNTSAILRM